MFCKIRYLKVALMVLAMSGMSTPTGATAKNARSARYAKYTKRSHRAYFTVPVGVFKTGTVRKKLFGRYSGSWLQMRFQGRPTAVKLVGGIKVVDNKTGKTVADLQPKKANQRRVLNRHMVQPSTMRTSEALLYVQRFDVKKPGKANKGEGSWKIPTHFDYTAKFVVEAKYQQGKTRRHRVELPVQVSPDRRSTLDRFWD